MSDIQLRENGFDVKEIVLEMIRKNDEKYPVEKSKVLRRNIMNNKRKKRIIPTFGIKSIPVNYAKCGKSEKENRNGRKK